MTTPTKRIPTVSKACIGCGACVSVSDGVFRINDEGYSVAIDLPDYEGRWVEDAMSVCPVDAIRWKEVV